MQSNARTDIFKAKIVHWFENTPLNKSILFFLVFCILSLLWGNHSIRNIRGSFKFIEGFLLLFIVLDTFPTAKSIKPLLGALLLGGIVTSLNGIAQFYFTQSPRIDSTFKDPTTLSAYLALILPLGFLFFKNKIKTRNKYIHLILFLIILSAFYLCYSRNTLFFLILSSVTVCLFFSKKTPFSIKITTFSLALLIFSMLSFKFSSPKGALLERGYLWKIAMNMVYDAPLLGHGIDSYTKIHKFYFPSKPQDMPYGSGSYLYLAYPHNSYLKLWIEIGLIGLLFYLYIYYCFFRYAFKIINKSQGETRFKLCLYLISIATLLTSTFFDTFLEGTQTRITLWLIIGLMMVELRDAEQTIQSEKVLKVVPETNASPVPVDVLQT